MKRQLSLWLFFLLLMSQNTKSMESNLEESFTPFDSPMDIPLGINLYPLLEYNVESMQIFQKEFDEKFQQIDNKKHILEPDAQTTLLTDMIWLTIELTQNNMNNKTKCIEKLKPLYDNLDPINKKILKKNVYNAFMGDLSDTDIENEDINKKVVEDAYRKYENNRLLKNLERELEQFSLDNSLIENQIQRTKNHLEYLVDEKKVLNQKQQNHENEKNKILKVNNSLVASQILYFNDVKAELKRKKDALTAVKQQFSEYQFCNNNLKIQDLETQIERLKMSVKRIEKRITSQDYQSSDYIPVFFKQDKQLTNKG